MFFQPRRNLASKDDEKKKRREKQEDKHENADTKSLSELMEVLSRATDVEDQLRKLIDDLRLTVEDYRIRDVICAQVQRVLSPFFERCKIYQFGSSINNFGDKRCDLDLFVDFQSDQETSVKSKYQVRLPFHRDLTSVRFHHGPLTATEFESFGTYDSVKLISRMIDRRDGQFTSVCPIPCKRCPLVKFRDQQTDLSCDLSFNNRKALYNSRLLRLYGSNPIVKSVVMAVRYWAKVQEVARNSAHAISSYALTWMVLFFLMYRQPQVIPRVWDVLNCVKGVRAIVVDSWKTMDIPMNSQLPQLVQEESPVDLLREFFHFYANEVDWDKMVLLTSNATFISYASFQDQFPQCQVGFMNMLDPFDLSHNVLQRVNDSSKLKFMGEIKRAAELSQKWQSPSSDFKTWGIATLFVPNSDALPSTSKTQSKRSKKKKKTDSAHTDETVNFYIVNFSPMKTGRLVCHSIWGDLVKTMLVNILQNVFMADIKLESNCLPCDQESNIEIEDEKERDASLVERDRMTASKTALNGKDTCPPIPWEISLDESPGKEELAAGCSKTTNATKEIHKQQSPPRAERKSESLYPSPSSSICQFACNDELKSKQSRASVSQSSSCNGESVTEAKMNKAEMNSDNGNIQPIVSQVKRSRADACLDKTSPSSETNCDIQIFRNAECPQSQAQDCQMISSKPASKKVRLLSVDQNEGEDKESRSKSFVCDNHHLKSEQVSEMENFDLAVPQKFHKNPVMEVKPEHLPSLLQSFAKAPGVISISMYSCSCSNPLWMGRNKMRDFLLRSNKQLQGLALERAVSRKLMETTNETQNQKADIAYKSQMIASEKTKVNIDAEIRNKKALLRSMKEADDGSGSEETSHSQAHLSNPSCHKTLTTASSHSDGTTLQFSCEIIQKYNPQSRNPVVQLRFYPLSRQVNSFKNFFSCAASMMTRLVAHNLLDND